MTDTDVNPFVLDPQHIEFRDTVRRFAREKFLPDYIERAGQDTYAYDELKQLADARLTALCLPEEHGGEGADLLALGIACEEVSYADPTVGCILFLTNVMASLVAQLASDEVRDEWLPRIVSGEAICCTALTEPGAGSDASALSCRAERTDGGWLLTGEKTSVTQAPHADLAIVVAQTDPGRRSKGIAVFAVPMDDPTVSRQRFRDPGNRPAGRGSIQLDHTFVPDSAVLCEPGTGFHTIMKEFDLTRTLIAMMVVGAAQRAIDSAVAYSLQRTSFGLPIAAYQGVSFPLAEHTTYLTAVRALAMQTLGMRMAGQPHTAQAAMLKWWAPQVGFAAINDAVVLHGHIGWSEEMPLQALLRDVSGYQIGDGTPQIQKLIIARDLLGR